MEVDVVICIGILIKGGTIHMEVTSLHLPFDVTRHIMYSGHCQRRHKLADGAPAHVWCPNRVWGADNAEHGAGL